MLIPRLNFSPEDSTGTAVEDKELSKEETIKLLGEDEPEDEPLDIKEKKEVKEDDEGEKEEEDEEKDEQTLEDEVEEDLEEPTDEDLELVVPVRKKEILAKYPDLFKTFPYLEKAYYRDQQFTEILPTIDDAKMAVEKATALDNIEAALDRGDTTDLLSRLKSADPEAFNRNVDNYMANLLKVDERAWGHVLGDVTNKTIQAMVTEAKNSNNDTLRAAAQVLNQFVFGSSEFKETKPLAKVQTENEEEKRISEREKDLVRRQYESARDSLSSRIDNVLKRTITENIDPRDSMTDYVRNTAIEKATTQLMNLIDSDSRFKVIKDKLWDNVFANNFSQQSLDKLRSTYLSKAKTLLPSVIRQARNDALKGMGKRVKEDSSDEKKVKNISGRSASLKNESSGQSTRERAQAIPKGMKTLDFLMKD